MNVAMRAAPDFDLVVHVIKVARIDGRIRDRTRTVAKRRSQGRRPGVAVYASRSRTGLRIVVEQGEIRGRDRIAGDRSGAIGFQAVAGIAIPIVGTALSA